MVLQSSLWRPHLPCSNQKGVWRRLQHSCIVRQSSLSKKDLVAYLPCSSQEDVWRRLQALK